MRSTSFYDDLIAVEILLDEGKPYMEESESINESYRKLKEEFDKFSLLFKDTCPDNAEFKSSYEDLTHAYLVMEKKIAKRIPRYGKMQSNRSRVKMCASAFRDDKSNLIKSRLIVNSDVVTPEIVSVINSLLSDSHSIGFFLNTEEMETLTMFEEFMDSIS